MPADLPTLRPLGFKARGKFPTSVDRALQASTSSVQFVRPDVPPMDDAPVKRAAAFTARSQPRLHGRSALEQVGLQSVLGLLESRP